MNFSHFLKIVCICRFVSSFCAHSSIFAAAALPTAPAVCSSDRFATFWRPGSTKSAECQSVLVKHRVIVGNNKQIASQNASRQRQKAFCDGICIERCCSMQQKFLSHSDQSRRNGVNRRVAKESECHIPKEKTSNWIFKEKFKQKVKRYCCSDILRTYFSDKD